MKTWNERKEEIAKICLGLSAEFINSNEFIDKLITQEKQMLQEFAEKIKNILWEDNHNNPFVVALCNIIDNVISEYEK